MRSAWTTYQAALTLSYREVPSLLQQSTSRNLAASLSISLLLGYTLICFDISPLSQETRTQQVNNSSRLSAVH